MILKNKTYIIVGGGLAGISLAIQLIRAGAKVILFDKKENHSSIIAAGIINPIVFEGDSANAKAVITGFGAQPGTHVTVTMFFARAGEITKDVIVRDNTEEYLNITSSPAPQPQP